MPVAASPRSASHAGLRAAWFVRVRWAAVVAQVATIASAHIFLDFDIPVARLLALTSLTAVSNALLAYRVRRGLPVSDSFAGGILVFDTIVLTGLLYWAGASSNPFTVLYLVEITIAAVMLGSRWTWSLAAVSLVCYAALFAPPHTPTEIVRHGHSFSLHMHGMWLALSVAAGLTAYFVTRLAVEIERREAEIAAMRETAAHQERLAALTTLAAGAAHELSTPMSTIAVTAGELRREIDRLPESTADRLLADVRLICAEVDRCGRILRGMAPGLHREAAEVPVTVSADRLAGGVTAALPAAEARRVRVVCGVPTARVHVPPRAIETAILNLVRNALEASNPEQVVDVQVAVKGTDLQITIRDRGPGMPADVLAHAGEPFFTTKPPGHGLGLGVFFARAVVERAGGRLMLDSRPADGTAAVLTMPLSVQEREDAATL